MSVTVSQYVLKVSSRCDLACDHCYVFEHADQSWRHKPRNIDTRTARQAAWRMAEHAGEHGLSRVHVVLHGGEPLLLGYDGLRRVIETLRSLIDPVTRLDLRIHTNGVRLDASLCGLFSEHGVRVGISLDGDRAANDLHRRFASGQSSFPQVRRALALLRQPEYRHLYAGILCTVDVRNDPIAVYEALRAEAPPRLDLLLPHATWDHPPYRPPGSPTPYADWLGRIHTRWVADGRPMPIRFFDSLLAAWEGRPSGSEAAGLDPVDLLVIETDGSWEQADSLKTAYDGAPATGLDVFSHSVDEVAEHPGIAARQAGLAGRCPTCRDCELVRACGGGLYAHRYKSGSGFDNPSAYCAELKVLIPQVISHPSPVASTPEREGESMVRHTLPATAFDMLAAGPGDAAAMEVLADSRCSVNRVLVAQVASVLDGRNGELQRAAAEGWELLAALDRQHPGVVSEVVSYPYVQAWAAHCLREDPGESLELDRAHVAGLAAAAAMRAGLEIELLLPVREGLSHVPGAGALEVGGNVGPVTVVRIASSGVSSRHGPGEWRTIRRIDAASMSFTVDDLDPFRDCHAWTPAGRLAPTDWDAWQRGLTASCQQLAVELPAYAAAMAAGLRSVVPMRLGARHRQSGTSRHAVGALAVALPGDVEMLSELLVHEMQHTKLAALSDLIDLVDASDDARFEVPWRKDLRPVDALLQGTYAHLAVAELWRVRSGHAPDGRARELFDTYRAWVENGIGTLLSADSLTPAGERFVGGMGAAVEAWADDR